ncbi:MAG: spore coat protein CotJB [Oscillospiraceae bacterium]|nr:spore coat protein CotJB [Oscillospiraceae bacterium]
MNRNRWALLNKISKTQFVLRDLGLFLDTHPQNISAIKNYEYYQSRFNELINEYEKMYGSLTPKLSDSSERWTWCDGPWPWETEYNEEM